MTNTNTSATGGILLPASDSPAPLEGQALLRYLQQWIVGLTGLPGNLVRPYWQSTVPDLPLPSAFMGGNAWCAVGVKSTPSDSFPVQLHNGAAASGTGEDTLIRHEELELLCSFYDLGADGQAQNFASLCRDGTAISQNHEYLFLQGFGFVKCGTMTTLPSLLKERWLYRVDLPITLRRNITRTYPVRNLLTAQGEFFTEPNDATEDWSAVLSDT